MSTTDDIPAVPDDGLPAPEVGQWSLEKYRLVKIYATIFARSMKHKWQHRIYIDLFAGAGRSTIRDTGVTVESSPMIALRSSRSIHASHLLRAGRYQDRGAGNDTRSGHCHTRTWTS